MNGSISRRSLLAGAGCAIAGTAAGQMLAAVAHAQDAPAAPGGAALCMTMQFTAGAKSRFEIDKYIKKHLPLLKEVYGDSVERIEVRTSKGSAQGVPPSILATSTLWIRDVPGFSQKLGANAERINKDLDSAARGNRLVQVDRIAWEAGDARSAVPSDCAVFSVFYPAVSRPTRAMPGAPAAGAAPPPSFDARFFVDTYLPRLYSLYGAGAVRRVEATQGQDQGGQAAAHLAAYHLMIRDRSDFDRRTSSVFSELTGDADQFTTIFPILADMRVNAIA